MEQVSSRTEPTPKRRLEDLALFSGHPAFAEPLHVGRPNIGDRRRLLRRIDQALESRRLTNNGVLVQELEQTIADLVGAEHCVAVCNATIGLEVAARAAGLSGEVIVPSFTFVATAHALQWQQITPVFCDVDPQTHNIDPHRVEELITPRTTGILGVHVWGRPCPVESLQRIADRHHLRLLFDAAHALGASHQERPVGTFGAAEVFSFHATKFVNSFEGGAIVTNDGELATRMRLMTNFGFAGYDDVVCLGTNGKMNEAAAAMALTSLESRDEFVAVNYRNYREYRRHLAGLPGVRLVAYNETERCNYQYLVLEIDHEVTRVSRDRVLEALWAENVLARRYFYPGCHRMEPYRSLDPRAGERLPETEALAGRVLVLPTGTAVGPDDIETICQVIRLVVTQDLEPWSASPAPGRTASERATAQTADSASRPGALAAARGGQ